MPNIKTKREINIFYAWQSDLPSKFTRNAIKKSLRVLSGELEGHLSLNGQTTEIIIDEATRDIPGSPNIPRSILEKIQRADIFVADVSIINREVPGHEKTPTPNPNVVFELGYAVSNLGWERIILLLNEVHGKVDLLPFDFDRHRAMTFKLSHGVGTQNELTSHLLGAVSLILSKNSPRLKPSQIDIAQTQRERDLRNLRSLLGLIHWPTIKEHIAVGPNILTEASTIFYEAVIDIVSSPLFHIYDGKLRKRIDKFVKHWSGSVKYDHYFPARSGRRYVFSFGHPSLQHKVNKDWEYMCRERAKMHSAMEDLLAMIRANFPEIDLRELSDSAGRWYDTEMDNIEKSLEQKPLTLMRKQARPLVAPPR